MMSPIVIAIVICCVLFGTPGLSSAVEAWDSTQSQGNSDLGTGRYPVTEHKDFPCLMSLLGRIVDRARKKGPQQLYVSPVGHEGETSFVRVYWPKDKSIRLITFPISCAEDGRQSSDPDLSWYEQKGRIDLKTGVVPTRDDVGASTYLVDRPWVDKVIQDCLKNGYPVLIRKHDVPK